jgi:K+-sensing histidine kinase KdpD
MATAGTAVLVAVLLPFRDDIDPSLVGWAFLGLVVITTIVGGLGPGILASLAAAAASNYFFVPPYDTFRVALTEHVVMLVVLLGLSALISVLLARARSRAEAAEAHERELQFQQDLARSLVEPTPGDEHYGVVLRVIVSKMDFHGAALLAQREGGLEEVVAVGDAVTETVGERVERLPLVVGRRSLGLLVLAGRAEPLTAAERRTLEAFTDQLALVMERDRMLRATVEAERARLSTS